MKNTIPMDMKVLLNTGEFRTEWLIELTSDNKEKIIFERDIVNGVYQLEDASRQKVCRKDK